MKGKVEGIEELIDKKSPDGLRIIHRGGVLVA